MMRDVSAGPSSLLTQSLASFYVSLSLLGPCRVQLAKGSGCTSGGWGEDVWIESTDLCSLGETEASTVGQLDGF